MMVVLWRTLLREQIRTDVATHRTAAQRLRDQIIDETVKQQLDPVLRPEVPERSPDVPRPKPSGHRLPARHCVAVTPILGGLHHEYRLQRDAA
jgi:hypothetical protein